MDIFKKSGRWSFIAGINILDDSIHIGDGRGPWQGEELLDFGRKRQRAVFRPHIERLDTKPIAREDQDPSLQVGNGQAPHPIELCEAVGPPLVIGGQNHLRIRSRPELMTELDQFVAEFHIIVDLTVECDPRPPGP